MTDYDKLIALMDEFGVQPQTYSVLPSCNHVAHLKVRLPAKNGGFAGILAPTKGVDFNFDSSGKFIEIVVCND